MQEFSTFFHAYYNKIVTWSDRMEFVNGWYILIIVSDTLTIAGSVLKIGIQTKVCEDLFLAQCRKQYVWMNTLKSPSSFFCSS